jgi:uncharacterized protein YjbJ (UPF0337 family)
MRPKLWNNPCDQNWGRTRNGWGGFVAGELLTKGGDRMNSDQLEGKWRQVKGEAREKWGKLTEDDINVVAGRREQLVGKIQERYGLAKEEATRQVDAFVNTLNKNPPGDFADTDDSIGNRAKVHSAGR